MCTHTRHLATEAHNAASPSDRLTASALMESMGPAELRVPVTMADLDDALAGVVPSVSAAELKYYEALRDKYAAGGSAAAK